MSILFYVYVERTAKIRRKCVLRDEDGTVFKPEFVTLRNWLANLAINKRAFFVTRVIRVIYGTSTNLQIGYPSSFNRSRIIRGTSNLSGDRSIE